MPDYTVTCRLTDPDGSFICNYYCDVEAPNENEARQIAVDGLNADGAAEIGDLRAVRAAEVEP